MQKYEWKTMGMYAMLFQLIIDVLIYTFFKKNLPQWLKIHGLLHAKNCEIWVIYKNLTRKCKI